MPQVICGKIPTSKSAKEFTNIPNTYTSLALYRTSPEEVFTIARS